MASKRRLCVAANWKMNGSVALLTEMAQALASEAPTVEVCFAPPALWLTEAVLLFSDTSVSVLAQDCSEHAEKGAYTGEIAAHMLHAAGVSGVLVGHSERRMYHREDSEQVAAKALQAMKAGLRPTVCVGESLADREAGETESVVLSQLEAVWAASPESLTDGYIAYEPVWAIGTGKTATPEQAQAVHAAIRQFLTDKGVGEAQMPSILYGGSVKPQNAAALFVMPDIDGALVGGAALNVDDFLAIVQAAQQVG